MIQKHKTGFTLVELLSVIVLLGIISVIIIPNFTGILKSSKEDLYNNQIEVIKTSAKLWTLNEDNKIVLSENTSWPYLITLGDLQDSGLLDELKNPKDDTYFSDSTLIYISVTDGNYTFTVDEESISASSNVITLNDERSYKVEINTSFTEPGYNASINGNDITSNVERKIYKNGVEVSSIDTTKISNYTIQYKVSYEGENGIAERSIAIRRVKIVDTIPPVLVCSSCNGTIELESNNTDSYEFPTVTATDNSLEDIKVIKMGSFSSVIPGQKKIIYIATDSSGNTGRLEILINVKDTIAPVISDIAQSMDDSGSDTIFSYAVVATDSGSGIKEYSFDGGNTWQKSNKAKFVYSDDTTRTIMVKDNSGNVSSRQIVEFISKVYVFDYTGGEQTFTVPKTGYYKLEVWGAQGGTHSTSIGGYGGYSTGIIKLNEADNLYVHVGGTTTAESGGYNGGGTGVSNIYGLGRGGGGATHIATVSGSLASLSAKINNILIVAGGGGGGASWTDGKQYFSGGGGGGISGVVGVKYSAGVTTVAGNQTSGNAFGLGQNGTTAWSAGSGGGLYGGKSGKHSGGAGGSGYIGNTNLINKSMYCYNCTMSTAESTKTFSTTCTNTTATANCSKQGNGYAKIVYIGSNENNIPDEVYYTYDYSYTGEQQIFTAPLDGYYKLETWGAQGGTVTSYRGGYGGYSSGAVALKKGDKLYVNVGGAGQGGAVSTNYTGGYNGGGATNGTGADHYHASGGGATHIAKVSGQLASIGVSKLDQVLIVAGGGGGAYIHNAGTGYASIGGSGGGYIGTAATTSGSNGKQGLGGSQTAGGRYTSSTETTSTIFGSFGKGGTPSASWGSAGGGGYYGGGASYGSTSSNGNSGGGGGSGYIGNSLLIDKVMYCYSCTASTGAATKTISTTNVSATATSNYAKSGNGYAIIKYLGK